MSRLAQRFLIGMCTKYEYQPFTIMSQSTLNWIFHAARLQSRCIWNFPLFSLIISLALVLSLSEVDWAIEQLCSLQSCLGFSFIALSKWEMCSTSSSTLRYLLLSLSLFQRLFGDAACRVAYIHGYFTEMGIRGFSSTMCFSFRTRGKREIPWAHFAQLVAADVHNGEWKWRRHGGAVVGTNVCILNATNINRWNLLKAVAVSSTPCAFAGASRWRICGKIDNNDVPIWVRVCLRRVDEHLETTNISKEAPHYGGLIEWGARKATNCGNKCAAKMLFVATKIEVLIRPDEAGFCHFAAWSW